MSYKFVQVYKACCLNSTIALLLSTTFFKVCVYSECEQLPKYQIEMSLLMALAISILFIDLRLQNLRMLISIFCFASLDTELWQVKGIRYSYVNLFKTSLVTNLDSIIILVLFKRSYIKQHQRVIIFVQLPRLKAKVKNFGFSWQPHVLW